MGEPMRVMSLVASLLACAAARAQPPPPVRIADELRLKWREQREIKVEIPPAPACCRTLVYFLGRMEYATPAGSDRKSVV